MKIKDVTVTRYREDAVSRQSPEILVVELKTDAGLTGTGFATAANAAIGDIMAALLRTLLKPTVISQDPRLTTDLWNRMYAEAIPRRGGDGLMRPCIAAIDFAAWDIKGKLADMPVASLFGSRREMVPTYANCAHHLPAKKLAERAREYVKKGHKALKLRGTRTFVTPAEATERVRRVREAVGDDIKIMVDVNGTWDVDTAIAQLHAWEDFDVYWLEEPVPPADIAGYIRIREQSGDTLIVGGEQHVGLMEFERLIGEDAVDIVQPNAALTGGITDWLRIHALATANSVPISPWNLQWVHLHLAAGLPNVKWLEYFMPDNPLQRFQTRLLIGPPLRETTTEDGVFLLAPQAPGLGLALDAEVAEQTRLAE
ncbi:MAG: mandelate racemase/muconate lactonizing enzyme family protein [Hyphomicrobiaceae bacterium]